MAKGGYRGGMPMGGMNQMQMMKQAQKMQENLMKMQEELQAKEYEATAGGGVITAVCGGNRELKSITIDPEVFANLAGDAATSCFGVKAMAAQAKDGGVFQLRRESMSKGIETQLGEDGSVSLGLHIAVDHGVNLMALCRSIINEVSYKVSKATGVPVKRVDVYVDTMLID